MNIVSLCNVALSRLGTQSTISDLTEASPEANACARFYEPTLYAVLAAHDWSFAKSQASLQQKGIAPKPWRYQYALPSDLIRARRVVPHGFIPGMPPHVIPFEVRRGTDSTGVSSPVLCTNDPDAVLDYTALVDNPAEWSTYFGEAFTWHLAAEIAVPITGRGELQSAMMQGFQSSLQSARHQDAAQQVLRDDRTPDFLAVRGVVSDRGWW